MPHHAPPHLTMPTITHHTQERFGPVRRENLLNRSHTIHHIHFFRTPVQYAHTYVRMYVSILTVRRYENSTSMGNQCNTSLKFDHHRFHSTYAALAVVSLSTFVNVHAPELECAPTGFSFNLNSCYCLCSAVRTSSIRQGGS